MGANIALLQLQTSKTDEHCPINPLGRKHISCLPYFTSDSTTPHQASFLCELHNETLYASSFAHTLSVLRQTRVLYTKSNHGPIHAKI